jgi:hypothetical protein
MEQPDLRLPIIGRLAAYRLDLGESGDGAEKTDDHDGHCNETLESTFAAREFR